MNQRTTSSLHINIRQWQDRVEALRSENNSMKEHLTALIRQDVTPPLLERAEMFHQEFMNKDQIIDLVRHELAMFPLREDGTLRPADELQYASLRKDINRLESELAQLKSAFSQYLSLYGL